MALILDTGVLFAILDRDDAAHPACSRLVQEAQEPLVLPAPVLPELDYLVQRERGGGAMVGFLRDVLSGAYAIENPKSDDMERAAELMDRYSDLRIGFVDAAVLAIVERLNEPKLATLDHRHFSVMRPRHVDALDLVPA